MPGLSPRFAAIVDALPRRPGAAACEVCRRIAPDGHILVIDRSATGIALTERNAAAEIKAGLFSARRVNPKKSKLIQASSAFRRSVSRVSA